MLPAGYAARRPNVDDAKDIFEVIAAHQTPVIGKPDATLEDVLDELVEPGFDLNEDGWLVHDAAGGAVGWGWTCRNGTSDKIDIDVYARPGQEQVAQWLWHTVLERAVAIGRGLGHERINVDIGVFPGDEVVLGLTRQGAFEAAARFVRMRIDHDGPRERACAPEGVELRHGTQDEQVRRDAIDIRNDAFVGHFGSVPKSFEEWAREREASSAHDWGLLHVAYVNGEPAATLLRTNNFVPDENCGYVLTLGTKPAFQGKGLASFLLRYAFAEDAALGRAGTLLHVDTNPERPALGFYQRNGMHPIREIDVWRRSVEI